MSRDPVTLGIILVVCVLALAFALAALDERKMR
jgi:hypothetical protein